MGNTVLLCMRPQPSMHSEARFPNLGYLNFQTQDADLPPGPTGVEAAGELGFEYGKNKEITLVTFHLPIQNIAH